MLTPQQLSAGDQLSLEVARFRRFLVGCRIQTFKRMETHAILDPLVTAPPRVGA
jgi:hypothetical protein